MIEITPAETLELFQKQTLLLVDVRPPKERSFAALTVPYKVLDKGGLPELMELSRDTPIAFLCHHGVRSAVVADYFIQQGFSEIYNIAGGIDAWADIDPNITRY